MLKNSLTPKRRSKAVSNLEKQLINLSIPQRLPILYKVLKDSLPALICAKMRMLLKGLVLKAPQATQMKSCKPLN